MNYLEEYCKQEITTNIVHVFSWTYPRPLVLLIMKYALYVQRIGQDIPFLCHWLKGFMLMHQKHFQRKAKNYLVLKGLSIESWSESVIDGRKAD